MSPLRSLSSLLLPRCASRRLPLWTLIGGMLAALLSAHVAAAQSGEVSGVLQSIDEQGRAELLLDERDVIRTVRLSAGDRAYLSAGDRIRGKMISQPGGYRLETVWPDEPVVTAQMLAINNRLRRDTRIRGRQVFRSMGERLPEFALFNQHGDVVRSSDLRGKTCVINFIFSRCLNPRMCPAATDRMQQLQEKVKEAGLEDVLFISITLDPDFDTPGVLHTYASGRGIDGSNFFFLSGPRQPLLDLKEQLGILANKDPELIVDHTMRTIISDPTGKIVYQIPGSMWDVNDFFNRIEQLNTPSDERG